MRKLLILVMLLIVSVGVVQAQDKAKLAPIIALAGNKLYAVSSVDGSAKELVEPPPGQTFFMDGFASLSPDGKHLVYATQTNPEDYGYKVTLFVLDVTSGKTEPLEPKGTVFDKPVRKDYHFRIDYPTWSVDGTRLYYVRTEADSSGHGKKDLVQLAYYDMATATHKLVARIDPKKFIGNLMAVEDGVIVHFFEGLGDAQPVTLYALDNRVVSENKVVNLYPYPMWFEGEDYYGIGDPWGGVSTVINIKTGEKRFLGDGFFPAGRSRLAGDQSLMVVHSMNTDSWYRVFGSDQKRLPKIIEDTYGVQYAVAPDGQSVAYLQYDATQRVAIRILEADGSERELPFVAGKIYWSAPEYVVFYEEAQG